MKTATLIALALAGMPLSTMAAPSVYPVVTPAWLAGHLADPGLVLLHVGDKGAYGRRHIPGAHYVELADISVERAGLSLELPDAADLKRRLEALGISDTSRVVVYYDDDWVSPATRVVFTLQQAGLGDRVSLLDGSLNGWQHDHRATTSMTSATKPGKLSGLHMQAMAVDGDFARAHMKAPGYVIIDARAAMFYDGLHPAGAHGHERKGHIPGARSIPFTALTHTDLTLKSPAELQALFRAAGIRPDDHLIVYCHIGQQGTAIVFAARAAGIDAVLYDGSFEDWTLHGQPVEVAAGR